MFSVLGAEGPCWPGAAGFSPCLRGIAWLGGGGGGGGWGRAPTATRALSSSSGSRGDGGGGGSSSPDEKLAAARAKREPAQGEGVGDRVAGGAALGARGGRGGYGASPRGGGSGGGGGRGGGGAGVKRKARFAERASPESLQLNSELSQAVSVEEILKLVDERADVFNAVNVSTALNKLW